MLDDIDLRELDNDQAILGDYDGPDEALIAYLEGCDAENAIEGSVKPEMEFDLDPDTFRVSVTHD